MVSSHHLMTGTNKPEPIEVVPPTIHISAETRGVDLTQPLSPEPEGCTGHVPQVEDNYLRDASYVTNARRYDMGERDHYISLEMAS